MPREPDFLFIVGCARTGTTAMCRLLNGDPRFALSNERLNADAGLTTGDFAAERYFEGYQHPQNSGIEFDELLARWDSPGVQYRGDKSPTSFKRLDWMFRELPSIKVIYMLRGIERVASSFNERARVKKNWPAEMDCYRAVPQWNEAHRELWRLSNTKHAKQIYPVVYEDFFSGDPSHLSAVLGFIGIKATKEFTEAYMETCTVAKQLTNKPLQLTDGEKLFIRDGADWDCERLCQGLAARARLNHGIAPETGVADLARLAIAAGNRAIEEERSRSRLLEWRLNRTAKLLKGVRRQGFHTVKAWEAFVEGLAARHKVRLAKAMRPMSKHAASLARQVREHGWQRPFSEAVAEGGPFFAMPGGSEHRFSFHRSHLVSDDGARAFDIEERWVRAIPGSVRDANGLFHGSRKTSEPPRNWALDVGTKSGDGFISFALDYAQLTGIDANKLAGAIGLDLNEAKLSGAMDAGLLPVLGDATELPFHDHSFDLVVVMELLEHVPADLARKIVSEVFRVARGAVFIQNPDFTQEEYLAERGLKFSWMGWHEHCHHITRDDLQAFVKDAGFPSGTKVEPVFQVQDSSHPLLVPLDAPAQTQRYSPELGEKPQVVFDEPVFEKMRVVVPAK